MAHTNNQEFKRHRAMRGADAAAKSPTRFAPYRKIVSTEFDERGMEVELLECGHRTRPRSDMIGRTYPSSRRCVDCLQASCEADGHPLVDWNRTDETNFGRPDMRCRCRAVTGEVQPTA